MAALSDMIESFLKTLIMEDGRVEVQRNELAEHFRCAPSQINYVLATRFSPEKGYIVQSRRGGAGYVRIVRVEVTDRAELLRAIDERIGTELSENNACCIAENLKEHKLISGREERLMKAAVSSRAIHVPIAVKDHIRADIMRSMVLAVFTEEE